MFSDDGRCVNDPLIMRRALEYARSLDAVVAQHAEDHRLTVGAQAHEGPVAARLGLTGWPASAEESIVARDAMLAAAAGARLHVCHLSTAGSVEVLRWARAEAAGLRVSAEVTPHHLLLTDTAAEDYDPVHKVNPPLRPEADTLALRRGARRRRARLRRHRPRPARRRGEGLRVGAARPGMLGLQTALSVVALTMVEPGLLDWRGVARVCSEAPARIAGLADQGRPLRAGEPANLTLVDPDGALDGARRGSWRASRTTPPTRGWNCPCRWSHTMLRGRWTVQDGKVRE